MSKISIKYVLRVGDRLYGPYDDPAAACKVYQREFGSGGAMTVVPVEALD